MVDSADLGFYGAAWRFTDFCQQLYAGSVYLQFVLKFLRASGLVGRKKQIRKAETQEVVCMKTR